MSELQTKSDRRVLVISDTHAPFSHPDTVPFLAHLKKKLKPHVVVHIGDVVDFHAMSNYEYDPNGYSPGHELGKAIEFLQEIYELFPKVLVCFGNHDIRIASKAFGAGIPRQAIRDISEIIGCPKGWSCSDSWDIDGVRYEHGNGLSGKDAAIKAATSNFCPTVIGHVHTAASVHWLANRTALIWAMNTGCLIDNKSYVFKYGSDHRNKPIISCGVVDCGRPSVMPMLLDSNGRWVGE